MTEPSDEERLAGIRETMSLYRHARERGFKNAGPGLDTLYYDHADLLLRLLDQRDERIRRLEAERYGALKEAIIAWSVCASIHREFCKGRDALYTTRQADFVKHEADARAALDAANGERDDG